ncbi:hypothetical protein GCM10020229_10370 [Kitasatospora albolonga]|uniref:hypothetical protein n=1 Tax=Kitasatospora albolonga TaxID=68173 RepID=UPI0031E93D1A
MRPARRLALSVRFIGGESNGSFARRLADANGIPDEEFWLMLGTCARKNGVPSDPRYSDGYLNAPALERLAVMAGRSIAELQHALPNLRPRRLLAAGDGPAWDWPWDASGSYLVRVCELCARVKGTTLDAYLASEATWQVCARHGRWLDNRREPGTGAIALAALPEVIEAHRQRLLMERRLGAGGRAAFADAYALLSCWWNLPSLRSPAWHTRRLALGPAGHDHLRVAPLLFYPEAVRLAQALAARERRRLRHTLADEHDGAWLARTADLIDTWDIPADPALHTLAIWASHHPRTSPPRKRAPATPPPPRPAPGRHRPLPAPGTPTGHDLDTTLGERSCLPWQLGELHTTSLTPATNGWTLTSRA